MLAPNEGWGVRISENSSYVLCEWPQMWFLLSVGKARRFYSEGNQTCVGGMALGIYSPRDIKKSLLILSPLHVPNLLHSLSRLSFVFILLLFPIIVLSSFLFDFLLS